MPAALQTEPCSEEPAAWHGRQGTAAQRRSAAGGEPYTVQPGPPPSQAVTVRRCVLVRVALVQVRPQVQLPLQAPHGPTA